MPIARSMLLATIFVPLLQLGAVAKTYTFDSRRSEVRFTYYMGPAKQQGHFSDIEGMLEYDNANVERSTVSAKVVVASLQTGEPIIDDTLKGSEFFNSTKEPDLEFRSTGVRPTGSGTAEMTGEITVRGITKKIVFQVSVKPHDEAALKYSAGSVEFIGTAHIQRSAFGMDGYQSMVGDDIDLEIDAVARPGR